MPIVFIPTMLLPLSRGVKQVNIDAVNLRQVIDGLDLLYPGMKSRLLAEGQIRPNLAVAVDGEVARLGLLEKVGEESEVHFVPAIGGGAIPTDRDFLTGSNWHPYNVSDGNVSRPSDEGRSDERGLMGKAGKSRVENVVSAGGVVYRRVNGRLEAVLCGRHMFTQPSSKVSKGQATNDHASSPAEVTGKKIRWSLAKGTPDAGETLEETALREVREETGLEVEIDSPIGSIEYWFTERGSKDRFHKTVHFYLMATRGGSTDQHDPEFDVVEWFPYDEALETVGYPNEVDVLRKALALISDPISSPEEKS